MKRRTRKKSAADWVFDVVNTLLLILVGVIIFYPLYFVLIASFSDPMAVNNGEVLFLPKGISFQGYSRIFQDTRIWTGYLNTIIYTVLGTILGVTITILAAFALSRKELLGKGFIMSLFLFTMYFGGGLIPMYLLVNQLGLYDTRLVIILLGSFGVWNLIVAKSFFQTNIPIELQEAANIDGCGTWRFFFCIALPISKAIVAVIALYIAVGYWNQYFNALIYLSDAKYQPLQIVLRNILISNQIVMDDYANYADLAEREMLAEYMKYGVVVVSSLPVLAVYPFLQKYFVQGVVVGAVKG